MSLGESIRHGTKWLLGGNVVSQALQFAFGVILARLLVPADFGLLVTVQIFTGLAGLIAGGGMGQALIRAKEAKREDFQVVFTVQLVIGLLIYASFFLSAPLFARWYKEPLYAQLIRVSAVSFVLRPFANMPNAWLTREMRFRQRTIVNMIGAAGGSILSVVLAWKEFGVWSLVLGGIFGTVLSVFALYRVTPVRPWLRFDATLARELGVYGLKFTSNELVSYIRSQTPNFLLGRLDGPSTVGLFNKADSLAKTPRIVAGSVYDPVFRSFATFQNNLDRSQYLYFRTITLLSVYMMPLFVGLAWLAQPFISLVYGPKWLPASAPLAILSVGGLFACIGYPSGAVLAARNWLGREVFVHLVQTALYVAACLIGIRWGLSGVAWGILLSDVISVFYIALLVSKCLKSTIGQLARSIVPGALLNLFLCGTLLFVDFLLPPTFSSAQPLSYILIAFGAGVVIYGLTFLFFPIPALTSEASRWRKALRLYFAQR